MRWATPAGPSSPYGGSTVSTSAMYPVNAADKPPDHRVIELIEHRQEPMLARIPRQAAERLAQHPGIGGQQRPDQRRRAVPQKELPRQHLAARLSRGRTARNRSAPRRLHR